MNVMIVCGGTGGHLFPGLAVGEELLKRRHQVLLVVSEKEVDRRATEKASGFLIETLPAIGWRGIRPDRVFCFTVGMIRAFSRCRRLFSNFHPNAVLGMGGFNSVAPLLWARINRAPSCIHESNAIPGRANRLIARFVTHVALGLNEAQKWFPPKKTTWTGTPVRSALRIGGELSGSKRGEARRGLGLPAQTATVLVVGGSQGARGLNRLATEAAGLMGATQVQWLHVTGVEDEVSTRATYHRIGKRASVMAFCAEMDRLYAAADLVVARAGASSLAEIAQQSLPAILVPYPFAADHHQRENARLFVEAGAAVSFEESACDAKRLAKEIRDILDDPDRQRKMGKAATQLGCQDAHEKLADLVEVMLHSQKP